jgi:hypothetical protein
LPLHRIHFIDDDMTVHVDGGSSYTTTPEAIAAIMPKTERKSRIGQWFARAFKGLKYVRAPLSLITVAWHLARVV